MYTKSLVMHTFIIQIQDDDTTKNIVEIPINTSSHTSSFLFPCNTMYVMYVCVGGYRRVCRVSCVSQLSAFLIQQGTLFQQLTQQLIAPTATLNVLTAIKFEFL